VISFFMDILSFINDAFGDFLIEGGILRKLFIGERIEHASQLLHALRAHVAHLLSVFEREREGKCPPVAGACVARKEPFVHELIDKLGRGAARDSEPLCDVFDADALFPHHHGQDRPLGRGNARTAPVFCKALRHQRTLDGVHIGEDGLDMLFPVCHGSIIA
jgi:hypothetical protein